MATIAALVARTTETDDGCWIWTGSINRNTGYGRVYHAGKWLLTHRVSYELHVGPIPDGLVIDHLCRVRACINPAHMEPVTMAENTLRGMSPSTRNAFATHCIYGHEFTQKNTKWVVRKGMHLARSCRQCRNRLKREARRKKHLAA